MSSVPDRVHTEVPSPPLRNVSCEQHPSHLPPLQLTATLALAASTEFQGSFTIRRQALLEFSQQAHVEFSSRSMIWVPCSRRKSSENWNPKKR